MILEMKGISTFVAVLFLSSTGLLEGVTNDECDLIQYLNIGESGTIHCSFETFLALSWYNAEENRDILFYKDGLKVGDGYYSGRYDIYPNGSLFVRNVTVDHEGVFTVIKVISDEVTVQYDIEIKTVVKPTRPYPIIAECADEIPYCLITVNFDGYIRCHIDRSRPSVNLTWIHIKNGSNSILPSNHSSSSHNNITFMSQTMTSYSILQLSLLNVFICQVSVSPSDLVQEKESMLILEKVFDYTKVVTPSEIYLEKNAGMLLPCSGRAIETVVWKQLLNGKDSWSTILFTIPSRNNFTKYHLPEFAVNYEGGLLLTSIGTKHEGLYVCIRQDHGKEDIKLYDVKVYVNPVPAYPAVDGCNQQQYCVLHVKDGDLLNCSILGIRPAISLEWKALQDTDKVSFEDRSHFVKPTDDRFDGILISRVSGLHSPLSGNRITVKCRVIEPDSHMFDLSTTVDLVFYNVHVTNQPVFTTLLILNLVVVMLVLVAFLCRRRATQRERVRRSLNGEENGEPSMDKFI